MKFVRCYPNSKVPVGEGWDSRALSREEMDAQREKHPQANWGLLLGPVSGVVDVECDSEMATTAYAKLFADISTPSWGSKRGRHYLYQYDPRLESLPGVVKYQEVEFRLGNGKATQSIIPPSTVDSVRREWIVSPKDCEPAKLPEAVIQALLALPPAAKHQRKETDIPEARTAKVERIRKWCQEAGIKIACIRSDHKSRTFIDLDGCPFKREGDEDGNAAIIVWPDGSHSFHCFHLHCAQKTFADLEAAFGPLYSTIRCATDLDRVVNQALRVLQDDPGVFQRGTVLVEVAHDAPRPRQCLVDNGAPQLRPIPSATITLKLAAGAKWEKFDKRSGKWEPSLPQKAAVDAISASVHYPGIPTVTGVVSSPILRADGTIANRSGYDRDTGLFLAIDDSYPDVMPVAEAVALLDDLLVDFPFATPAHRSGWYSALLSLQCRAAFPGPAPLHLFDANVSRAGKGMETDGITMIIEGRKAARYAVPKRGDDELRKLITSVAMSGAPYILFDNIKHKFGGHTIENALTTGRWSDRILGVNQKVDLPLNWIWMGTANNATLTSDMIGRTLHIRLETTCERPDLRTDFRHPDLIDYIKANRAKLAMAAVSIPAAYIAAGRPDMTLPKWGGFEGWSALIRNSLVWAGLSDPGETREALAAQADEDTMILDGLMAGWTELGGRATVGEAIVMVEVGHAPMLSAFLAEFPGDKRQVLGNLLRDFRGRVRGGRKFERTTETKPTWCLVTIQ